MDFLLQNSDKAEPLPESQATSARTPDSHSLGIIAIDSNQEDFDFLHAIGSGKHSGKGASLGSQCSKQNGTDPFSIMKVLQQLVDAAAQRWIPLDRVFDVADSDLSGTISQDELIGLLSKLDLKNVNIDNLWSSLDTDGDGELSKQEWQDAFEGIKPTETATVSITWNIKPTYQKHIPGGLVALIAHNKMKAQMATFVEQNIEFFKFARIVTTGSTGKALEGRLGLSIYAKVASGPLGGDQEIGAMVTKGHVAGIFFFKDPLSAHQHAADIEALTRVCDVHSVPYATNASTGKALVLALASYGLNFGQSSESDTVRAYKAEQAKVIQATTASA